MLKAAFLKRLSAIDSSLGRSQLESIWDALNNSGGNNKNSGSIGLVTLHNVLSNKFGKDKSALKANVSVIDRVVAKIISRAGGNSGGPGIKGLMK